jgi:hypothetical protein
LSAGKAACAHDETNYILVQVPPMQVSAPVQTLPQRPQFVLSLM